MVTTVRRSDLVDKLDELVTCVVCRTMFPRARGYVAHCGGRTVVLGCLACLASFECDPGRHSDRQCPDCRALEPRDSPVSEWVCF